jgi:hypothetical protein
MNILLQAIETVTHLNIYIFESFNPVYPLHSYAEFPASLTSPAFRLPWRADNLTASLRTAEMQAVGFTIFFLGQESRIEFPVNIVILMGEASNQLTTRYYT